MAIPVSVASKSSWEVGSASIERSDLLLSDFTRTLSSSSDFTTFLLLEMVVFFSDSCCGIKKEKPSCFWAGSSVSMRVGAAAASIFGISAPFFAKGLKTSPIFFKKLYSCSSLKNSATFSTSGISRFVFSKSKSTSTSSFIVARNWLSFAVSSPSTSFVLSDFPSILSIFA